MTDDQPQVIVETRVIRENVPENLTRKCPEKYAGPVEKTGDFVARGDHNEAALATCSAQVDGVREWNRGPK